MKKYIYFPEGCYYCIQCKYCINAKRGDMTATELDCGKRERYRKTINSNEDKEFGDCVTCFGPVNAVVEGDKMVLYKIEDHIYQQTDAGLYQSQYTHRDLVITVYRRQNIWDSPTAR